MRYAAVSSLTAGLVLIAIGVSSDSWLFTIIGLTILLWTGSIQVGWWVYCALQFEKYRD